MAVRRFKEAIHSGHFMVSDFEADAEDEEDLVVPPPPSTLAAGKEGSDTVVAVVASEDDTANPEAVVACKPNDDTYFDSDSEIMQGTQPQSGCAQEEEPASMGVCGEGKDRWWSAGGSHLLDVSLHKLFQNMSIAYRHKLTSPKWNRFRGLKLRWKDKIRLNNVIWRCWHLQFMKDRQMGLLCAFANPLEIDNHSRTEGSTLLEGKYWKRRLQTITKEYMRWRMFYKTRAGCSDDDDDLTTEKLLDQLFRTPALGNHNSKDDIMLHTDAEDADLLALFNLDMPDYEMEEGFNLDPKTYQPIMSNAGGQRQSHRTSINADLIQPGVVQLQPNLDDLFMDMDNHEWLALPPTPAPSGKGKGVSPNTNKVNTNKIASVPFGNSNGNMARPPGKGKPDVFTYREKQKEAALASSMSNDMVMIEEPPTNSASNLSSVSTVMVARSPGEEVSCKNNSALISLSEAKVEPVDLESQSLDLSTSYSTSTSTSKPVSVIHHRVAACTATPVYKSHSPKHRILYQRSQDYFVAPNASAVGNVRHSPYVVPPRDGNTESRRDSKTHLSLQSMSTVTTSGSCSSHPPSLLDVLRSKSDMGSSSMTSTSLLIPQCVDKTSTGNMSSTKSIPSPTESPVTTGPEQRRKGSVHSGFDTLRSLLPALAKDNTTKISKAALLHKAGDHLREMKRESELIDQQIGNLRNQIKIQRDELDGLQEALPTVDGHRMRGRRPEWQELPLFTRCFNEHVHNCTLQNWKYWVFASLFTPLFQSYIGSVSNESFEDLVRSTITWMDQQCNVLPMRQSFGQSLTQLAINTNVLAQPDCIPQEAIKAVTQALHNNNQLGHKKEP